MFRLLAKLLGLLIGASIVGGAASALAALNYRKKALPLPAADVDEIELAAVMEATEYASTARAFRGGRVVCWYAGLDVDLREAELDPAGARLDVRTVFGGTRVVVAPGVRVHVTGPAIFGGRMDSTGAAETSGDAPGLEITGFTLFGGLQVIASERGEELQGWARQRAPGHDDEEPGHEHAAPAPDLAADVAST